MLEYHAAYFKIDDGWYMAQVLDFPGVVTQGKTLAAARKMVRSAIHDMAQWYLEDGQALPQPKPKVKAKKAVFAETLRLSVKAISGVA
jgi:predicted RNase H-like HicB family nuclease